MDSSVVEDEPACSELPTDVVIRCISRGERHDLGDSASWSIGASSLGFAGPEGSAFFFITEAYSTHRSVIDLDRRDISKIFIRSGALLTLAGLQVLYFVRLHAKTWLLKPDASKRLPPLFLFYLENYSRYLCTFYRLDYRFYRRLLSIFENIPPSSWIHQTQIHLEKQGYCPRRRSRASGP